MLKPTQPSALYRIDECANLLVDACLCDEQRTLIFLSVWGRDTAVQELLGRLTIGAEAEEGLTSFHLVNDHTSAIPVEVGHVDRLQKHATRELRQTLFGTMLNVWLIERRCIHPDKANSTALAVFPRHADNHVQRLWSLVQDTCPLPLLEHWRDAVLDFLQQHSMLSPLPPGIGPLEGYRLALDVPVLTAAIGELIRVGQLTVESGPLHSDIQLARAA